MSSSITSQSSGPMLRIKAPAKINLHLEVLGLRNDGFHELAMVMQTIDLADFIEIKPKSDGLITLTTDSPELATGEENLIVKAAKLLRSRSGMSNLGAAMHLEKNIPIGAGLAGGSSDGAAALFGLNVCWNLSFTTGELIELASELGSDVAFCLEGGSKLCFGRGEKLEDIVGPDEPMSVILVKDPDMSISTPWAYELCKEVNGRKYLNNEHDFEVSRQQLRNSSWLHPLRSSNPPPLENDLENVVSSKTPSIENSLSLLRAIPGSLGAAMSGSGPSCFALFSTYKDAKYFFDQYRHKLEKHGLQIWCCPFCDEGVRLEK